MHILLPSDTFPPGSVGGAAWSAHALALALTRRGHSVTAVVPIRAPFAEPPSPPNGSVPTVRWPYYAPPLPFVQNYYRHERLWPRLATKLVELGRRATDADHPLLIHAQHVQTTPAAVLAGARLGVPVVATVRDHWPWDYFATGLHGNRTPAPPRPTLPGRVAALLTDLVARMGGLRGLLALPAIPYMLAHVQRRAALLAQADAVIAVSGYIAERLAPLVPAERLHVIPNMVNIAQAEHSAAAPLEAAVEAPFLLYIGKLERNKGAALLPAIFQALRDSGYAAALPPLVVAGNGALRTELARELAALGVAAQFLEWVSHDEILRLMARCTLLLFPSAWGEPLSRVLLEASALGAPIVAMPTGGTPDIIVEGESGMLAASTGQFGRAVGRLVDDEAARQRLGAGARRVARQRFAVEVVLPRVEQLYQRLLAEGAPQRRP
jgi:glycosyltransferase involved in cell wall biosynthesis